jgi:acetyltransferase
MIEAMRSLLDPKAVAVVGASQRRGRGTNVVANLRDCGFAGEIFAVNPRYQDVLGYKCFPSVSDLPASVDCLVVAVAADAACDILEEAHARGIPAAIVLAAGFGEGGHGHARAARLRSLAGQGMCICGPNCFGLISVKAGFAAYSGPLARPLRAPGRDRVAERRPGCECVCAADDRPRARVQSFRVVREPDRRDGRGLRRIFHR